MPKKDGGLRTPTKAEIERDRVFSLVNDPRYQATVGLWLQQEQESLTREAMMKDGPDGDKAKGGWLAIRRILDRIDDVIKARKDEVAREAKRLQETINDD